MSRKQRLILELLASQRRWWFGLELIIASEGKLARGTVYIHLSRLQDAGHVVSKNEERIVAEVWLRTRRCYKITESGLRELASAESGYVLA